MMQRWLTFYICICICMCIGAMMQRGLTLQRPPSSSQISGCPLHWWQDMSGRICPKAFSSRKLSISSISSKWKKNQEYFFLWLFVLTLPCRCSDCVWGQYSSLKPAKTNFSKRTELKIVFWLFLIVLTLFLIVLTLFLIVLTLFSLSWLLPPCPPPLPCRVMGRGLFPILRTGAGPQNPAYLAHHCERPCFYICCFTMFYYLTGPLNKSRLSGPSLYHETLFLHLQRS